MRLTAALVVLVGCVDPEPETGAVDRAVTGAKCPDGETIQGIDVSEYQESVDWAAVKASGRVFGIARINVGDHLDPYFQDNWNGMRAAGMIRGAYQYYKPSFDPVQQADLVVSTVGVLGPDDLPAMLDIEILDGVAPAEVVARLRTWLDIVEAGTGKRPLVYTGAYFWDDNIGSTALADYPLVIPWYGTNCPGVPDAWNGPGWKFHQYSESGTVPGVSSNPTDLDVYNGSEAQLRAWIAPSASCGAIGPAGGTIDDDHPCFRAGGPSQYLHRVSTAGEGGGLIWTHATAEPTESNFAEWRLDLEAAGRYRIEVYTAAAFAQSRQARYVVTAAGVATDVVVDQTATDGWQSLGEHELAAGGGQSVHLGDNTGEAEADEVQLVFDAVRVTPIDDGGGGPDAGPDDGDPGDDGGCSAGGGSLSLGLVALLIVGLGRRSHGATMAKKNPNRTPKMSPSRRKREEEMPAAMKEDETARNRASQRRSDDIARAEPMRGGRPAKPLRGE
jgi:GH25 family lysozyme M1 (1,4-beta-N-acetylmuramidase)